MKSRKDSKGRALRKGEYERPNAGPKSRYVFMYTDWSGKRISIYAEDLPELRMMEDEINYQRHDGIDIHTAGRMILDEVFDRYIGLKQDIKDNVKANYIYMYGKFVRGGFGSRKIRDIRYSDVKEFYYGLLNACKMKANTLDNIHTVLHPTFALAVKDGLIRTNPTEGVMREIKRSNLWKNEKRTALTEEQTKKFFEFLKKSEIYSHWYNMLIIMYGLGLRVGELVGLRWEDIDLDKNVVSVNHNVVYFRHENGKCSFTFHDMPKTGAGIREVPMFSFVREAVLSEYETQKITGFCEYELDGYRGFVFKSRTGGIYVPQVVNRAIDRIIEAFNKEEIENAVKNKRTPEVLPHFSCHILRHTICARLCENEENVKFIQDFMGHADITTTMDIYAEFGEKKKQEKIASLDGLINMNSEEDTKKDTKKK